MGKTGVVLLSMGGPDSLEAIQPFLYNLFSDHDIIRIPRPIQKPVAWLISKIRARKTRHYYELMGGKSPQKEQTIEQAKKLQELLGKEYKVVVAMRYWHPFTEEALEVSPGSRYQSKGLPRPPSLYKSHGREHKRESARLEGLLLSLLSP